MPLAERPYLPALRIGSVARDSLTKAAHGQVAAVFERCCYIQTLDRFICLGAANIGNGPLNLLMPGSSWRNFRSRRLQTGTRTQIAGLRIKVEHLPVVDATDAAIWTTPQPSRPPDRSHVRKNWDLAKARLQKAAPCGGLSPLMFPKQHSKCEAALIRHTTPLYDELKGWLAASFRNGTGNRPDAALLVRGLVGAGPGLTPSGDDLLAGALVTLHRLGALNANAQLSEQIARVAQDATNAISAAHLAAAAQGLAAESVIRVIDSVYSPGTVDTDCIVRDLNHAGATSGWDFLAGMAAVLESW